MEGYSVKTSREADSLNTIHTVQYVMMMGRG